MLDLSISFFGALKQPAAPVLEPMAVLWGVKGDGKKNWGETEDEEGKWEGDQDGGSTRCFPDAQRGGPANGATA